MNTAWNISISVENTISTQKEIDILKADCHKAVAALLAYHKHARPQDEAKKISTSVESKYEPTA